MARADILATVRTLLWRSAEWELSKDCKFLCADTLTRSAKGGST